MGVGPPTPGEPPSELATRATRAPESGLRGPTGRTELAGSVIGTTEHAAPEQAGGAPELQGPGWDSRLRRSDSGTSRPRTTLS